ncbi:DUF1652 domain-containing protein [Pseudomonas sp. 20P_3.2_Bac4]|jgi:hypothetical protein|nr:MULTISPECIES: DUF1652 domain-containing protein [unclassified Pseudomonas]MCU1719704.1 DUF1652 domain-containing protein [Pseudomonas sp. 5P_5.1_Bac1]MCU1732272.1 DUF1652 domain-containing protein [Pseudomonas sp. 20P_3.2_Bac4]MCU1745231.1 DUF1652 domain-containing protein [Pseudomonas sp. 20P_3.2_Bac5]
MDMLSTLELRDIVEKSFLPVRCRCTLAADHSLTVQLFDRSQRVDLQVNGIRVEQLNSSRAISSLVSKLRCDLLDKQNNVVQLRDAG